jgi:glutathione synthase/RimK-type ligase-like ATP-grasp enzyme
VVSGGRASAISIRRGLASSQAHTTRLRIALVTYSRLLTLSEDDRLLVAPLAERGVRAEAAAWDDAVVKWDSYDALVLRSTWNYHTAIDAFRAWIDRIDALGVPIWNPPSMLRWNASKTYLRDLAARGIDVVPTRWIERGAGLNLRTVLGEAGWLDAVVKPAISASAYETWRVSALNVAPGEERRFGSLIAAGDVMVQPFLPELARHGEWSLMFVGGEFSHAVIKRPRSGDFRVQHEHGGSAEPRTPPAHVLATAREIVSKAPGQWLYARVDGVEIGGSFVLVELEMLEPSLFLATDPRAPARFADAIVRSVGGG